MIWGYPYFRKPPYRSIPHSTGQIVTERRLEDVFRQRNAKGTPEARIFMLYVSEYSPLLYSYPIQSTHLMLNKSVTEKNAGIKHQNLGVYYCFTKEC